MASQDVVPRGTVHVADQAVERIARAAVLQVDGVAPAGETAGSIGTALGRAYPHVACRVAGDRVRAVVEIATTWPAPASRVARDVQAAVTDQLERLAGIRVDAVEVVVAQVVQATKDERRVQ